MPPAPKPTTSGNPSPFTSTNLRGYTVLLVQPLFVPYSALQGWSVAKPAPVLSATRTPPDPNPTRSANPSPFTSTRNLGYVSSSVHPKFRPNAAPPQG